MKLKIFLNNFNYTGKNEYTFWKLFHKTNLNRSVFLGLDKDKKNSIFVKEIKAFSEAYKKILKEIYFLVLLYGKEYIVKLDEILYSNNKEFAYLIFKGKNDKNNLNSLFNPKMSQSLNNRYLVKWIIFQIASGLFIIHSNQIIHNDIKPENILINRIGDVEICDFGNATYNGKELTTGYTHYYVSPEFLLYAINNEKSDMWSLGVIIIELLLKKNLFFNPENIQNQNQNENGQNEILINEVNKKQKRREELNYIFIKCGINNNNLTNDEFKKYINEQREYKIVLNSKEKEMISDKDAIDLIEHLLVLNPKKRYSAKEVLNSNYLEQFKNLNPNINLEDLNHHKDYDNLNNITINSKSFEQKLNDLFDNLLSKMCDLN